MKNIYKKEKTEHLHILTEDRKNLFHNGIDCFSYEYMGAHFVVCGKEKGVMFRVWAPNACKVSVVGAFNDWNENLHVMNKISYNGIYEIFIKGLKQYDNYKYVVFNKDKKFFKADPYAVHAEKPSGTASKLYNLDNYIWGDEEFHKNKQLPYSQPINIYEVNLSSWKRKNNGDYLTFKDFARQLIPYVKKMGYTHIELMPITEHPFDGSWGYQVTGYYAITSRFGTPKDFMYFVDCCHKNDISVIIDWVPAHFPKDEHGLYMFDGQNCYESNLFGRIEHKTWGTHMFDWGRTEVKNFLISNAMFFFDKFHIDGLRIDAVASMLYLDYDRKDGEWMQNIYGGNYNLEAIDFFKKLNEQVFAKYPKALMIAEESTSFPMITKPTYMGGLGFNFKWNMGWMNDSLSYMQCDPYFRANNHDKITFSMYYAFSENFVLPISHDEVVHGKKSLLDKMPGDINDKFANLRAFNMYMMAHPGKKLNFMGNEFGQFKEWNYSERLEFFMLKFDRHRKLKNFNKTLNIIYKENSALYQIDDSWNGFKWISVDERDNNIIAFERKDKLGNTLVALINFSGNNYFRYRLGLDEGVYKIILNSDFKRFGGNGIITKKHFKTSKKYAHGKNQSIVLNIPKFTGLYFIKEK